MFRNAGQKFVNGSSLPLDAPERRFRGTNTSRNSLIDSVIKPGPYKEVMPCIEMCYDMVKKCPASMGFACPSNNLSRWSYGELKFASGDLGCNYPGASYNDSSGWSIFSHRRLEVMVYALGCFWAFIWVLFT